VQVSPYSFPFYVGSLAYDAYVLISCFPTHHGMDRGIHSSLVCAVGFSQVMRDYICVLYEDPPEVVKSRRDSLLSIVVLFASSRLSQILCKLAVVVHLSESFLFRPPIAVTVCITIHVFDTRLSLGFVGQN